MSRADFIYALPDLTDLPDRELSQDEISGLLDTIHALVVRGDMRGAGLSILRDASSDRPVTRLNQHRPDVAIGLLAVERILIGISTAVLKGPTETVRGEDGTWQDVETLSQRDMPPVEPAVKRPPCSRCGVTDQSVGMRGPIETAFLEDRPREPEVFEYQDGLLCADCYGLYRAFIAGKRG